VLLCNVIAELNWAGESMSDYNGYLIKQNPDTRKWEVFWKEKKVASDFARQVDAEEYLDDLLPMNRTS
jgi:hypothetical protein